MDILYMPSFPLTRRCSDITVEYVRTSSTADRSLAALACHCLVVFRFAVLVLRVSGHIDSGSNQYIHGCDLLDRVVTPEAR